MSESCPLRPDTCRTDDTRQRQKRAKHGSERDYQPIWLSPGGSFSFLIHVDAIGVPDHSHLLQAGSGIDQNRWIFKAEQILANQRGPRAVTDTKPLFVSVPDVNERIEVAIVELLCGRVRNRLDGRVGPVFLKHFLDALD